MVMLYAHRRCFYTSLLKAIALIGAFLSISALGCGGSNSEPLKGENKGSAEERETPSKAAQDPKSAIDRVVKIGEANESWRVTRLAGSKTGFSRVTIQSGELPSDDGATPVKLVTVDDETRVQRFGEITEQKYTITSLLTEEGGLLEFVAKLSAGPRDAVTRGVVKDGKLQLVTRLGDETQFASPAWESHWGGVGADDLSLQRQPMKPGEKRKIDLLAPVLHSKMTIELTAKDWRDDVEIPDGRKMRLLELEWTATSPGLTIGGAQWMDAQGRLQISTLPTLDQVTYRTDRKTALITESKVADLGVATIVKLSQPLAKARETKRVVYKARLKHSDPSKSFVSGLSQRVRVLNEREAEIEVLAIRPSEPADVSGGDDRAPVPADSAPNSLIQSDDSAIVEMAAEVAATDPWEAARQLEKLVHERIDSKNFSQAFASAADVARQLEGDCTEHAVLLAALCRAKKIPARVAVGLVYFPRETGFAYHMWNEVWIADRWVPLDATLGAGGVGAERLKVSTSNLDGASPYAAFLPVLPLIQQLELEVVKRD